MSQVTDDDDLLEEFESERPGRHLSGITGAVVAVGCAGLSIFAISWVVNPLEAGVYRPAFLAIALFLTFLVFGAKGNRDSRPTVADWTLAILSLVAAGYASVTSDELFRHAADPTTVDLIFGIATILLVLEATRRTVGWILPAICIAFLAYAYLGGLIPEATRLGHKGYGLDRIIGQTYLGLEGIFGIPLDVAATYIVLFAVYGAVLEYSGASRFFVELSHAAFGGSATGPGRTTTLAGFLLGTVSGSGVATTVTLGSVSWPLLRRAGYPKDEGGGILAAAGIGAILSPPTLGAAAFIIAELLEISYLEVLVYALVPSLLYYLGILLAIEADARKHGVKGIDLKTSGFWRLLARSGYHFASLVLIVVLLGIGISPFRAVLYATVLAFLLSFLDRRDRMGPRRVGEALVAGARGVLPIAATTAAAGIMVAVISLTGLGLELSSIIVDAAGGSLALTADLLRDRRADPGPRDPGHGVVHHRRGRHRAGARRAGRRGLRRLHVRLLLRGAERGQPADRAVGIRRGGHHRRRRHADDDADVPLHAAGLPRAVRLRAVAQRRGAAAGGQRRHRAARHRRERGRRRGAGDRAGRLAARPGRAAGPRPRGGRGPGAALPRAAVGRDRARAARGRGGAPARVASRTPRGDDVARPRTPRSPSR